jgi:hypothetical protein
MKGKSILGIVVVALALAAPGFASATKAPKPLTPDQAQAAASAVSTDVPYVLASGPESPATAAQTASQPGTLVEVGSAATAAAASGCWYFVVSFSWGIFPYQQKLYDHTTTCGNGSTLTYRSTSVTHGTTLCDGSGDYSFKTFGGVGYSSVTIEVGAYYACPTTIPYITIHTHHWMHDHYTAWGTAAALSWG